MNRNQVNTLLWGILMLLLGIIGLLYNFSVLDPYLVTSAYGVAVVLALAGAAFLVAFMWQRQRWPFVIPGFTLLALAVVVYLAALGTVSPVWLGVIFLGGVVLAFLILFLGDRTQRWWALLQAGFIASMAVEGWAIMRMMVPDSDSYSVFILGALLFGGFAISFLLLYVFAGDRRRFQWALVMTGVFGAFALVLLSEGLGGSSSAMVKLWPLLLIVLGAFLISRLLTGRGRPATDLPTLPEEALAPRPEQATVPEPARIVRPREQTAPTSPVPAPEPEPAPAEPTEPLPDELQDVPLEDPAAALDALLDASQKAAEDE